MAVEQFLYLVRELDRRTLNLIVMLVAVGAGVSGATGKAQDVVNPRPSIDMTPRRGRGSAHRTPNWSPCVANPWRVLVKLRKE